MNKKSYKVINLHSFYMRVSIFFAVYVLLVIGAILDKDAKQPIYMWMVFGIVFYIVARTLIRWFIAAAIVLYVSFFSKRH